MEHAWTVICRRSIIDQKTNNISLIDVIERVEFVTSESVTQIPFEYDIVSLWSRTNLDEPEKSKGRLEVIYAKTAQKLDQHEYDIDLTETPRARGQGSFMGLPFVGNGIYKFVLSIWDDGKGIWREVGSVPLQITQRASTSED